jgi:subtilisin family serine protease
MTSLARDDAACNSFGKRNFMTPLDLVKLTPLMEITSGRPDVIIGMIDGPVAVSNPDLVHENIREVPGTISGRCAQSQSIACAHGTFVAGILCAKRNSVAPAICSDCTLLVRPIFSETTSPNELIPSATPEELAMAIIGCIEAGARLLNLSAALAQVASAKGERALAQALDYASARGVIVVAASGNQGTVGSTAITRHPAVIPVIACDRRGRPLSLSNLGSSIGRRGLSAPGSDVKGLPSGGTSVAAPFVTGTLGLVWSEFFDASASQLRSAVTQAHAQRRPTVVPTLLNAWGIHNVMRAIYGRN